MATTSFPYEPPRYDLLPKNYKQLEIEKYLFRIIVWLFGLAVDWKDNLRKPTLGKLACYFVIRYLFNLTYHSIDYIIESLFDWLIADQRSPTWQTP